MDRVFSLLFRACLFLPMCRFVDKWRRLKVVKVVGLLLGTQRLRLFREPAGSE